MYEPPAGGQVCGSWADYPSGYAQSDCEAIIADLDAQQQPYPQKRVAIKNPYGFTMFDENMSIMTTVQELFAAFESAMGGDSWIWINKYDLHEFAGGSPLMRTRRIGDYEDTTRIYFLPKVGRRLRGNAPTRGADEENNGS
jgi:hypothetical protein